MSHYSTEDFEDYESDYSISVWTEDSYDPEILCSNDSCESANESTEDETEDEF